MTCPAACRQHLCQYAVPSVPRDAAIGSPKATLPRLVITFLT